ncbi:MAG: DUF983 domain-containing protein [Sphingomonadales bacterium]|nr:DUF983 domain-containing protein [Sphingomonadales bacterium]
MIAKPLPASIRPQTIPADLPLTVWQAMKRGGLGCCPRCGLKGFFPRLLKPVAQCRACGQDWTHHRADDFPPYVAIIVTGHLMAPVMIVLASNQSISLGVKMAVAVVIAALMIAALLQPAKGAIIALQWWNGMHGFLPSGRDEAAVAGHPEG